MTISTSTADFAAVTGAVVLLVTGAAAFLLRRYFREKAEYVRACSACEKGE